MMIVPTLPIVHFLSAFFFPEPCPLFSESGGRWGNNTFRGVRGHCSFLFVVWLAEHVPSEENAHSNQLFPFFTSPPHPPCQHSPPNSVWLHWYCYVKWWAVSLIKQPFTLHSGFCLSYGIRSSVVSFHQVTVVHLSAMLCNN